MFLLCPVLHINLCELGFFGIAGGAFHRYFFVFLLMAMFVIVVVFGNMSKNNRVSTRDRGLNSGGISTEERKIMITATLSSWKAKIQSKNHLGRNSSNPTSWNMKIMRRPR
jgi:hypothetical protein